MTPPESSTLQTILEPEKTEWRYEKAANAIRQDASFSTERMVMNLFATIIATYGLLANNVPTIIGAMLISMLLGPITGIALSLAEGDYHLLRKSVLVELLSMLLVFSTAFIIAKMNDEILLGSEIMVRTHPNLFDLVVALACGTAIAFALVSKKLSVGIIGVAISVSLTPPLAASGILFAHADYHLAFGAFLLFFTNLVGIEFSASTVFWLIGCKKIFRYKGKEITLFLLRNAASLILIISLAVILSITFRHGLYKQIYEDNVKDVLTTELKKFPHTQLVNVELKKHPKYVWVIATIRTPKPFTHDDVSMLSKGLPKYKSKMDLRPGLEVREILMTEFYVR